MCNLLCFGICHLPLPVYKNYRVRSFPSASFKPQRHTGVVCALIQFREEEDLLQLHKEIVLSVL